MTTDERMEFMSPEHVAAMNERLRDADVVHAACRELGVPRAMQFRLANGPGGADVYWTTTYDQTMQFALEPHPSPDVVITGDWSNMIRASASAQTGNPIAPDVEIHGDAELLATLQAIVELARPVATLDVRIPEL